MSIGRNTSCGHRYMHVPLMGTPSEDCYHRLRTGSAVPTGYLHVGLRPVVLVLPYDSCMATVCMENPIGVTPRHSANTAYDGSKLVFIVQLWTTALCRLLVLQY